MAAAALLLLNRSAAAFRYTCTPPPIIINPIIINHHRGVCSTTKRPLFSAPPSSSTSLDTIPSLASILDDGHGHINSALASAIYEWETAHTQIASTTIKKEFSTRDGLRLVDELAREVLSSLDANTDVYVDFEEDSNNGSGETRRASEKSKSIISYNDLVQEGIIALLRAMSTFPNYKKSHGNKSTTFEKYAKEAIHSSFLQFIAATSRPIRLPSSLQTTLEAANTAARYLRNKLGREPSLVQVAKEVHVQPQQLALYRKLYRKMIGRVGTFVSMEDGLEVYDPSLAGYVGTGLRPRSDSDAVIVTKDKDASSSSSRTRTATPSDDEDDDVPSTLFQLNTQEDDWERQPPERIVAPLRDVLTDTEEINNPLSYTHHFLLNEELNEFLSETLSSVELEVIQLRFGLVDSKHGGRGWSATDIGERMGMSREEVREVASVALEKLRQAAAADDDAFVEVSL